MSAFSIETADSFASNVNTVFSICADIFDLSRRCADAARRDQGDSESAAFMRSFWDRGTLVQEEAQAPGVVTYSSNADGGCYSNNT